MVYGTSRVMPNGNTIQYGTIIFLCIVTPTVSIGCLLVVLILQPQAYKCFCAMMTCCPYGESIKTNRNSSNRGSLELGMCADSIAVNAMHHTFSDDNDCSSNDNKNQWKYWQYY